jgi:hypothetical protein
MSFEDRGFTERGAVEGVVNIDMMGTKEQMPWTGVVWADSAGEVGGLCDSSSGTDRWLFVSIGAEKRYLTMPGQRDGGFEFDGVFLNNVADGSRDALLASHLAAVRDDVTSDADGVAAMAEGGPQLAIDLAGKLMAMMTKAME